MANEGVSAAVPQIVICGSIAIDRIMNFKGRYSDMIQPDKIHVLSVSMLLDKLEDSRGGIGANIAHNLAQLGERPYLVGSVGHDANEYINDLTNKGVNTEHVHFSDLPTASFNVITDSDDNQVGGFYQGAMSDSKMVSFRPWQNQEIIAVVAPNNPEAMNRQVDECQELNFRLVYDPGQQVSDDTVDVSTGVNAAEVLFVNDYELGVVCKKLKKTIDEIEDQVPIVITTYGKNGSRIAGTKLAKPIQIGVAKVEPIDPTGAGDAYRAGFLYGYLRQWDLKKCGQLGATLASFIVEKHGTQHSFTKEAVQERYLQNFNQEIEV